MDIILAALDEVALEGLEGTTINGLMQCLRERVPPLEMTIDENVKRFIWDGLLCNDDVQCYIVDETLKQEPEVKFEVTNTKKRTKFKTTSGDESIITTGLPKNWISDIQNKIYGFCTTYNCRRNVTEEVSSMNVTEVEERYGDNLYLVGSQYLRFHTLAGEAHPPTLSPVVNELRYTMLEIIGKTRNKGFMQLDLKKYKFDPRSSFHHIKLLSKNDLITKQTRVFTDKHGRCITTKILFLRRFHQHESIKSAKLAQTICKMLSAAPNCAMEVKELKEKVGEHPGMFKKIRRWLFINGYIQYVYDGEIITNESRCPDVRVLSSKPLFAQLLRMYETETDDADKYEEVEDDYVQRCATLDPTIVNEITLTQQAHAVVKSHREEGSTLVDLSETLRIPKFWGRSLFVFLDSSNVGKVVMVMKNKQRIRRLVSLMYLHNNKTIKALQANKNAKASTPDADQSVIEKDEKEGHNNSLMEETITDKDFALERNKELALSLNLRNFRHKGEVLKDMKSMSRINFLLDKIQAVRITDDASSMYKSLILYEERQGEQGKCCRRSCQRILDWLEEEELIKVHRIPIEIEDLKKTVAYYCVPSIDENHESLQRAIQQTKFRLAAMMEGSKKKAKKDAKGNKQDTFCLDDLDESIADTDTEDETSRVPIGAAERNAYNYLARFTKIKHLHMFLWQLVYGSKASAANAEEGMPKPLLNSSKDYDWMQIKRTLPEYDQGEGWFKVGDIIAVMPLSLFCMCGGIRFKSKTIMKYLKDPARRMMFISQLPPKLKAKVTSTKEASNILSSVIDCAVFMVQMGLMRLRGETLPINRTQIMLYLTKETMIVDTTFSEKGYCEVSLPPGATEFPRHVYTFSNLDDVLKYWLDVEFICLNTPLGHGKGTTKDLRKSKKIEHPFSTLRDFKHYFIDEDIRKCKPALFGDGLGAGGYDSTFFAHLGRNWRWKDLPLKSRYKPIVKSESKDEKDQEAAMLSIPMMSSGKRKHLRRRGKSEEETKKKKRVPFNMKLKYSTFKINRRVEDVVASKLLSLQQKREADRRKRDHKGKRKPDEADHVALRLRKGIRAQFSPVEDRLILFAVTAMTLLGISPKRCPVWLAVRNFMHNALSESLDKTVVSIARRARQIMKSTETKALMRSCVVECANIKGFAVRQDWNKNNWESPFLETLEKVCAKYKNDEKPVKISFEFPRTYKELFENFDLDEVTDPKPEPVEGTFQDLKDIVRIVLRDLIHNAIAGRFGKGFSPSVVYRIFQNYSMDDIDAAVEMMRKLMLIVKVKCDVKRHKCVAISTMRYDMSVNYERIVESMVPRKVFAVAKQAYDIFLKSLTEKETKPSSSKAGPSNVGILRFGDCLEYDSDGAHGGLIALLINLVVQDELFVKIDIPDHMLRRKEELERERQNKIAASKATSITDQASNSGASSIGMGLPLTGGSTVGPKMCHRSDSGPPLGLKRKGDSLLENVLQRKKCCVLRRADSSSSRFNVQFSYVHKRKISTIRRTTQDSSHIDFVYTDEPEKLVKTAEGSYPVEYQPNRPCFANINYMLQKAGCNIIQAPGTTPEDAVLSSFGFKFKGHCKPFLEFLTPPKKGVLVSDIVTRSVSQESSTADRSGLTPVDLKKEGESYLAGSNFHDSHEDEKSCDTDFVRPATSTCALSSTECPTEEAGINSTERSTVVVSGEPNDGGIQGVSGGHETEERNRFTICEGSAAVSRFLLSTDIYTSDVMRGENSRSLEMETYKNVIKELYGFTGEEVQFNISLLEIIKNGKEFGFTRNEVEEFYLQQRQESKLLKPVDEHIQHQMNFGLVVEVGAVEKIYVASEHSLVWCLKAPIRKDTVDKVFKLKQRSVSLSHVTANKERITKEVDTPDSVDSLGVHNELPERRDETSEKETQEGTNDAVAATVVQVDETTEMHRDASGIELYPSTTLSNTSSFGSRDQSLHLSENATGDKEGNIPHVFERTVKHGNTSPTKKILKRKLPHGSGGTKRRKLEDVDPTNEDSQCEVVWRISRCRPWLEVVGDLNPTLLKRFQLAILSYIICNPGVRKQKIYEKYRGVLQHVAVDDVLEYLIMNKAITIHYCFKRPQRARLFQARTENSKVDFANPYYLPSPSSVTATVDADR